MYKAKLNKNCFDYYKWNHDVEVFVNKSVSQSINGLLFNYQGISMQLGDTINLTSEITDTTIEMWVYSSSDGVSYSGVRIAKGLRSLFKSTLINVDWKHYMILIDNSVNLYIDGELVIGDHKISSTFYNWLQNIYGKYCIKNDTIYFSRKKDAMLYKLVWE